MEPLPIESDVEWNVCGDPVDSVNQLGPRSKHSVNLHRIIQVDPQSAATRGFWKGDCVPGQLTNKGYNQLFDLGNEIYKIYFDKLEWSEKKPSFDQFHVRSTDVW